MRAGIFAAGLFVLAATWLGPLPDLARGAFSAHMTMHMAVVAIAAPLVAIGVAGRRFDPARAMPGLFAPIPASVLELIVVWLWHVPAFHHAARHHQTALVLEQATFLAAGLFLWLAAAGGDSRQSTARAAAGIGGLLFTSIHMTLLGALFALAPRLLYGHATSDVAGASALDDQHLGGAIMLLVGGVSYLAGGLWLTTRLVRTPSLGHEAIS